MRIIERIQAAFSVDGAWLMGLLCLSVIVGEIAVFRVRRWWREKKRKEV